MLFLAVSTSDFGLKGWALAMEVLATEWRK